LLLDGPRPKYGDEYDREPDDTLGAVLRALIVGLLAGGRGTDREAENPGEDPGRAPFIPSDRTTAPAEVPAYDLALLCGVLDTLRAAEGDEDASGRPSEPRLAIGEGADPRFAISEPALRPAAPSLLCEAAIAGDGLEPEFRGGVILLAVGREVIPEAGRAAAMPAFDPSMLARVGEIFGLSRLALDRFRKALPGMLTRLPATDSPRSSVFRETAVIAPGRVA
jgi:hypothetical protein